MGLSVPPETVNMSIKGSDARHKAEVGSGQARTFRRRIRHQHAVCCVLPVVGAGQHRADAAAWVDVSALVSEAEAPHGQDPIVCNAPGTPLIAGWLHLLTVWLLSPMIAGLAMRLSSVSVIGNTLRLKAVRIQPDTPHQRH